MATVYKVLGQSNPAATTATTLYTVPAATSTVVSTIVVANLGVSGTYRIAIRPAGAALASSHYIAYDGGEIFGLAREVEAKAENQFAD